MKLNLLLPFLLLTQILSAQNFIEMTDNPFESVKGSSIAFSDVDRDGDKDVLITGNNISDENIAKLYINDGVGNFSEMLDTPFDGVQSGSITFSDVDGDGDEDVLIAGLNNSYDTTSKLYTNDGVGNFSEILDTPFENLAANSVIFTDIDGDGDKDVIIEGYSYPKLYINDGTGNFSEIEGSPFEGVSSSSSFSSHSIHCSDVDGDGDDDVLITGGIYTSGNFSGASPKLYTNDGVGNFSEMTGTLGSHIDFASFSDVDGDGDEDILTKSTFYGPEYAYPQKPELYTNDGTGKFSYVESTPFEATVGSSITFSDIDRDGDEDVLISGHTRHWSTAHSSSRLYINLGMGNFLEKNNLPFHNLSGAVAFSDIDGDGDEDMLISGINDARERITKLYINTETIVLIEVNNLSINLTPYPNPAKSNQLQIDLDSTINGFVSIKVFDLSGRLLKQRKELIEDEQQSISIDITSFAQGTYLFQLDYGKKRSVCQFFIL